MMAATEKKSISTHQLAVGKILQVTCKDLNLHGYGLAEWNSWLIVVPNLLPGEIAQVQILKRLKSQWISCIIKQLSFSSARRLPPCSISNNCGGCSLQHLEDNSQAQFKQRQIEQTLLRIGGISISVEPLLTEPQRTFGYRNRALLPLSRINNDKLLMGYYQTGSHRIVDLDRCPVLDHRIDRYLQPIKYDLQNSCIAADSDLSSSQGLRHLGLRVAQSTGEVLLTLVSSDSQLPQLEQLAKNWYKQWPEVLGVTLNIQPEPNNIILGNKTILLAGQKEIEEDFCGLSLKIKTTTFFQVNTSQAERIVLYLRDWFTVAGSVNKIVDAYCGIGTITLPLADYGFNIIGIELNKDSVAQAKRNALHNNLLLVSFESGDVAFLLTHYLEHNDALIVDPPRKGLDKKVIKTILKIQPALIAYLSCDPATLARDLKQLVKPNGPYLLYKLQPIDFFPQTTHVECLALLERFNF